MSTFDTLKSAARDWRRVRFQEVKMPGIKAYVPTVPETVKEIAVQFIAIIAVAWIISQSPALKQLMRSANSLSVVDNPPQ